ncbi:hypothetical protein [Marinifilum caeruleilacunae]|uniref:Protein BatD n=1 Tax=Marinifilum caeruleilacunae TaxID=2499076 RepID=A0ABX1WTE0_9BACT|nr:hypothetical protein [Marinifilum caeruleilacunae]NOU59194.1 hypothetical protein [Marinifilum caeruleilacunae]
MANQIKKHITFLTKAFALTLLFASVLVSQPSIAQNDGGINYGVKLDTNVIVIGDQINLKLSVDQPKGLKIGFPVFSDSIVNGVEIIKQFPQDTTANDDGTIKVDKNYTITSFDGGVYKLKPFEFQVYGSVNQILRTDTLLLGVKTMQIDTTKGNFDIVMPIQTPISFAELAPWILSSLLVLALIVFLIWYFRFRQKDQPLFAVSKPIEPAHVTALKKLDEIKQQKLWQGGKVKQFHSDITDTIRTYLDERYNMSTQESTTDEILDAVSSVEVNNEWHATLREVLERADLAKFAKFQPLPNENERSMKYAYQIVESTILIEKEEEKSEESEQEEKSEDNK